MIQHFALYAQDSVKIYHALGDSAADQGNFGAAINYYTREILLDSTKPEPFEERGDCYRSIRAYQKALNDLSKAMQLAPRAPLFPWKRSRIYDEMGEYDKAIDDCNKAISLTSAGILLKRYYCGRGLIEAKIGREQAAIISFTRSIEMDYYGLDWLPYYLRGFSFFKLKKYQQAIEDYDKSKARYEPGEKDPFPDIDYKKLALEQLKK